MVALIETASEIDRESRRRTLMDISDGLLDEVEDLRLADRRAVPESLREAIKLLQARLGRSDPAVAPATLRAAHNLVLGLQSRLMAANPRHHTPRSHPGRPGGQPALRPLRGGLTWKHLTLPPAPSSGPSQDWSRLVEDTVERGYQRWLYAHYHALEAARRGKGAPAAWSRLQAAWWNYWELKQEAEKLWRAASGPPPPSAAMEIHRPAV